MRLFSELIRQLEQLPDGEGRVSVLARYFHSANDQDAIWALSLLSGKRPRRVVSIHQLSAWAIEKTGFPVWLFKESHRQVGDLAETIARVLPPPGSREEIPLAEWMRSIIAWGRSAVEEQQECIELAWDQLDADERILLNKLVSGGFRLRVKPVELVRALQENTGIPHYILAMRLADRWDPESDTLAWMTRPVSQEEERVQPLEFHDQRTLTGPLSSLGDPMDWLMEDQWDGIPIQLVRQQGNVWLWTMDHQMVAPLFSEIVVAGKSMQEDTVLEGVLMVMQDGKPGTMAQIQSRMDGQRVTKAIMRDNPVCLRVRDCLVWSGEDIRKIPFSDRWQYVESLCASLDPTRIQPAEMTDVGPDWAMANQWLSRPRDQLAGGILLKHRNGYHGGEAIKDIWWTKSGEPFQMDMVVLYVESVRDRSSMSAYELTFGLWDVDGFVPVTKTGVGLTQEDGERIKAHVREHTLERFGPVRQVAPTLVYTIIFDGVSVSLRHKSGIILLNPRICAWKEAEEVAGLQRLSDLKKRFTKGF